MQVIPDKIHLAQLPDMDVSQIPPRLEDSSTRGLVLLPIFLGFPNFLPDRDDAAHHVTRSAIWARRSWLMNTDALDYGIAVKFYVEEHVRDSAAPIFEKNFVDEADILWFDGSQLEGTLGSGMTHGIKKCSSYNDDRFRDYDWIFDVDSDVFVISPDGEKYPFFRNFFNNCPENTVGACYVRSPIYQSECLTPDDMGWSLFEEDTPDAWKGRFEAIAGRDMLEKYFDPKVWIMTCNGSIIAFPAKHFMRERRTDCDFFVDTTRELLDLEATLSLWHSLGNPLYNITNYAKVIMYHAQAGQNDRDLFQHSFAEGPFLFHYSFSGEGINHLWKRGIGCTG